MLKMQKYKFEPLAGSEFTATTKEAIRLQRR
jgi:hypothetical protein